jgi:hypothetical protein
MFSKCLQHSNESTWKNMQHVQYSDLLLKHPYITIATYLWNLKHLKHIFTHIGEGEVRAGRFRSPGWEPVACEHHHHPAPALAQLGSGGRYEREQATRHMAEARSKVRVGRATGEARSKEQAAQVGRTTERERGVSEWAVQGRGAVGERCSSERSETWCPREDKRHGNEKGIKKTKLRCTSRYASVRR